MGRDEVAGRLVRSGHGSHLRDFVYGGIDGAVTTFAIVAGVEGAGLETRVIIALGIANVLADGFSMAAGDYSATKADLDELRRLRALEERRIDAAPASERDDLREILRGKGLSGETLESATEAIAAHRDKWVEMMLVEGYGLSPVDPDPLRAALATFVAFLAAGLVPLAPFLLGLPDPFLWSILATGSVFACIGALKSRWSLTPWWVSATETLLIGGAAAAIAYIVGSLFE
ncbi:VIT1/CCC1 transporter family protein [Rhodobacteraceae bacterium MCCB 386]|nr:VIT1/CCC1 transporter family protein [Roseitranquillus sediminis]MBM9594338.1 VIT1/CCC1 transporter family protein [Roseitranquillus sediminis]